MRRPLVIYEFWISLYMRKIWLSFLSVWEKQKSACRVNPPGQKKLTNEGGAELLAEKNLPVKVTRQSIFQTNKLNLAKNISS